MYKIDSLWLVRVKSTGWCHFKKKIPRLVGRIGPELRVMGPLWSVDQEYGLVAIVQVLCGGRGKMG